MQIPHIFDQNDADYTALIERQQNAEKDKDTHRCYLSLLTGLTTAVQCEDGGPLVHGMVVGHGFEDHSGSYIIMVMNTRHLITRNQRNVKNNPIQAGDFQHDEEENTLLTNDMLEELKHMKNY